MSDNLKGYDYIKDDDDIGFKKYDYNIKLVHIIKDYNAGRFNKVECDGQNLMRKYGIPMKVVLEDIDLMSKGMHPLERTWPS